MDWLILIVSLPAIIVPVVLLFGFAGCGLDTAGIPSGDGDGPPGTEPGVPSAPQNFSVVAQSDSAVLATWDTTGNPDGPSLIEGVQEGGDLNNPTQVIDQVPPAPDGFTVTTGLVELDGTLVELEEGRTYIYQIKFLKSDPNNASIQIPSPPSNPSSATVWPKTPSDLVAIPVGLDGIDLTWSNASTAADWFSLEGRLAGGVFGEIYGGTDTTYPHRGLAESSQYDYRVRSIVLDGYEDSAQQDVPSAWSTVVSATTFKPAFEVDPAAAPNTQPGWAGDHCFVQRISAGKLLAGGGGKVGIKVRGAPASNVTINRIYISQVGPGNPWNSAGDLTPVRTLPLTLPDDQPQNLDSIVYNLDKSQDLLIAFDFTATPGADTIRYVSPQPGVTLYFKAGVQQASLSTRDPDYSTGASQLYLVVTIGVP
jgi:hypothetical protein